jgi:hypothetical protein
MRKYRHRTSALIEWYISILSAVGLLDKIEMLKNVIDVLSKYTSPSRIHCVVQVGPESIP